MLQRSFTDLPCLFNCTRDQVRVQPSPGRTGARPHGFIVLPSIIHPAFRNPNNGSKYGNLHIVVGVGPLVIGAVQNGNGVHRARVHPPITPFGFTASPFESLPQQVGYWRAFCHHFIKQFGARLPAAGTIPAGSVFVEFCIHVLKNGFLSEFAGTS